MTYPISDELKKFARGLQKFSGIMAHRYGVRAMRFVVFADGGNAGAGIDYTPATPTPYLLFRGDSDKIGVLKQDLASLMDSYGLNSEIRMYEVTDNDGSNSLRFDISPLYRNKDDFFNMLQTMSRRYSMLDIAKILCASLAIGGIGVEGMIDSGLLNIKDPELRKIPLKVAGVGALGHGVVSVAESAIGDNSAAMRQELEAYAKEMAVKLAAIPEVQQNFTQAERGR